MLVLVCVQNRYSGIGSRITLRGRVLEEVGDTRVAMVCQRRLESGRCTSSAAVVTPGRGLDIDWSEVVFLVAANQVFGTEGLWDTHLVSLVAWNRHAESSSMSIDK